MSTVVRTERHEHFIEWSVALPCTVAELDKAREAAHAEALKLSYNVTYDDYIMVIGGDDSVTFQIKVVESARDTPTAAQALISAANAAEMTASTMRGDPNEIAHAEGYAEGLAFAVEISS